MTINALSRLDVDASTAKRAQYEAFEFDVHAPGMITVTNGSYGTDKADEHEYIVNIEGGVPVACECPADEYHSGACKHRVAVAIREPVLTAATAGDGPQAVTDGGVVAETPADSEGDTPREECWCADSGLPCFEHFCAEGDR